MNTVIFDDGTEVATRQYGKQINVYNEELLPYAQEQCSTTLLIEMRMQNKHVTQQPKVQVVKSRFPDERGQEYWIVAAYCYAADIPEYLRPNTNHE